MNKATKRGKNWRIQVYAYTDENGKRIYQSFTAPTKAEVEYKASKFRKDKKAGLIKPEKPKEEKTLKMAAEEYVELSQVLSPSTIAGYKQIINNRFKSIQDIPIDEITSEVFQKAINAEMKLSTRKGTPITAKTVRSAFIFYNSVLKYNDIELKNIKLPKIPPKKKEFPDPAEVIEMVKGTNIELPCLLAMWLTFTMSEIRGLTCSSIHDGYISINQVMVRGENGDVIKNTGKVETRLRTLILPQYIRQLINNTNEYIIYRETGKDSLLVPLTRSQIYDKFHRMCQKRGWTISFHDLRAMSASIRLSLNVPDRYCAEVGGWSPTNPQIMKTVYQRTFAPERERYEQRVNDYLESLCNQNMQP